MSNNRKTKAVLPRLIAMTAFAGLSLGAVGCIQDTDCGVCDPDNLVLEAIAGINYASDKIKLLSPRCEGPNCPGPITKGEYFIEEIGPCEETEEAQESPDPEEFCKLSPLVTAYGIEFIFNNLLDATSIELVRKRPDNPNLFEVYDWKSDILSIEGPITRYNGDYQRGGTDEPDQVTRLVNLTCIENLAEDGIAFDYTSYQDPATNPCNQVVDDRPRKMRDGEMKSYRGGWSAGSNSCSSPEEGPDTCCTRCDWLLSTKIARYGLVSASDDSSDWQQRSPNVDPGAGNAAIVCSTGGSEDIIDKYDVCRDFIVGVDRSDEEGVWRYQRRGDDEPQPYKVPRYDYLRETHPDQREPEFLSESAKCSSTAQCGDTHGLAGTECIGKRASNGASCLVDATRYTNPDSPDFGDCRNNEGAAGGHCQPQWFVTCRSDADTTGGDTAYCVDRRFGSTGTAACYRSEGNFKALCDEEGQNCETARANTPLAFCDHNENNRLTAAECCQDGLGTPTEDGVDPLCDPFYQSELSQVSIYDRDDNLPEATRDCICRPLEDLDEKQFDKCATAIRSGCYDANDEFIDSRRGEYAVKFVARVGGVVYDPALKGFDWRPADTGTVGRADIEACAEGNVDRLIPPANRQDGWRANDTGAENQEDFDRGLCSGQTYTVNFAQAGSGLPVVQDKVGNTLEGKSTYTFETSQFHIVPQSGFPTDNLRIGACDAFSIRTSNKYDMSPENLAKLQLWRVDSDGDLTTPNDDCGQDVPVAGGPGCAKTKEEIDLANDPCLQPCLTVDVSNQVIGEVEVEIDPTEFGPVLTTGNKYRVVVPTAASVEDAFSDPDVYAAVFWDICGMPLVNENAIRYTYDFSIDRPKCKEDVDQDNVQLSCDNAPDFFNPDQGDIDGDGLGDVIDLCPLVAGTSNTADSDRDGVGNECDSCRQTLTQYNQDASTLGLPAYMQVRNIPFQLDTDQDGIGDVCDNCILSANCEDYGPGNPYGVGDPLAFDNDNICQRDDDADMIGNACEGAGMVNAFAAGPIGLGALDDFDQDGIDNESDACPRQPLDDTIMCTMDEDCPAVLRPDGTMGTRKCELYDGMSEGICDHLDSDADDVGDICDSCPFAPNPMQVVEGGMQEDDEDGDFVGSVCETSPQCADTEKDPRPFGFYEFAANGNCCIVSLIEGADGNLLNAFTDNPVVAPHPEEAGMTIPVRVNCSSDQEDAFECVQLPPRVAQQPGILTPPPGCDGVDPVANYKNRLTDLDFPTLDDLWATACFLPQFDQDFDGLGDPCDLCPFDFDPENQPYIDLNGRVWPNDGAYCNGLYSIDNKCSDDEPVDTDGDTEGGTDGGSSGGGSGGGSGG